MNINDQIAELSRTFFNQMVDLQEKNDGLSMEDMLKVPATLILLLHAASGEEFTVRQLAVIVAQTALNSEITGIGFA